MLPHSTATPPTANIQSILTHLLEVSRENSHTIHLLLERQERMTAVMLDHHSRQISILIRATRERGRDTKNSPRGLKMLPWMPHWMMQAFAQGAAGVAATSALYHAGGDPWKIIDLLLKLFA